MRKINVLLALSLAMTTAYILPKDTETYYKYLDETFKDPDTNGIRMKAAENDNYPIEDGLPKAKIDNVDENKIEEILKNIRRYAEKMKADEQFIAQINNYLDENVIEDSQSNEIKSHTDKNNAAIKDDANSNVDDVESNKINNYAPNEFAPIIDFKSDKHATNDAVSENFDDQVEANDDDDNETVMEHDENDSADDTLEVESYDGNYFDSE